VHRSQFATTVLVLLAAGGLVTASPADATEKCRVAVVKESAKIAQAAAKLLQKCEESVRAGKLAGPCPDPGTAAKLAGAKGKTGTAVAKACATSVGELNYGSCPNAQGPNGTATCGSILITSKTAAGECLACLGEEHAQEMTKASYGSFVDASADKKLAKCQATIGKSTAALFVARSKLLAKCQGGVLADKLVGPCPDGDQKTIDALAKAEAKMEAAICKACGGADKLCDGVDDLAPATIGFAAQCPRIQVGFPLGAEITDLPGLVGCLTTRIVERTTCTDIQALSEDSLGLPGNCEAEPSSCDSDGGYATVRVAIANASGGDLGGVSISLGYRGVAIPGTGDSADYVTNLQSGLMVTVDYEAALTVAIVTLDGLVDGPLFDIAVATCAEPDAFGCVIRGASDTSGNEILENVTCTATVL